MRCKKFVIIGILSYVLLTSPLAMANFSSPDVMNKMSEAERSNYLFGLVNMLSYITVLDGDKVRAGCIHDQFYNTKKMGENIMAAMLRYPDKPPEAIIIALMKKACPK